MNERPTKGPNETIDGDPLSVWTAQAQLRKFLEGQQVGEICGVRFDLRDSRLPDNKYWHAPDGGRPFGIAFPWDRALFGGDEGQARDFVTDNRQDWETVHVYAGDAVSIHNVRKFKRADPAANFDDHDLFEYWVYFCVLRIDGTTTYPSHSVQFVARDGVAAHHDRFTAIDDDDYDTFQRTFVINWEKICLRIDRFQAIELDYQGSQWVALAARLRDEINDEISSVGGASSLDLSQADEMLNVYSMVDSAAAVGYALAKAESFVQLVPLAVKGEKARKSQVAATAKASARADPVRAMAAKYISEHPNTSQTACAVHIASVLVRDQRSIERAIKPLFELRVLPGGGREKRPKRS